MRLAILNTVREYGGGEKWAISIAAALTDRGHEVILCGQPNSELCRRAAAVGLPEADVLLRHDLSLPSVMRLARLWRRLRPDVVLACTQRAVRLAAWSGWLWPPLRLVYRNGLKGSFKNKVYNRLIAPKISFLVANAAATQAEVLAYGWLPQAKLQVIYNGAAPPQTDPDAAIAVREEFGCRPGSTLILAAGRLVHDKGHHLLLQAIACLNATTSAEDWLLVIAGEGPQQAALAATVERLRLGDRVHLAGFREDIGALYGAADLLVHPSRREGAPNAILEAMAAGLPVVATAIPSARELLGEDAGCLVPPEDAPALATALAELLADAPRRARLGEAARRRAEERFSREASIGRWEALLTAVAAGEPLPDLTAPRRPKSVVG